MLQDHDWEPLLQAANGIDTAWRTAHAELHETVLSDLWTFQTFFPIGSNM